MSIMRVTEGFDSGAVCLQEPEPIRPDDDYGTLAARLQRLGGELLVRALDERPPFTEQDESQVTYAHKIQAADRALDPGALLSSSSGPCERSGPTSAHGWRCPTETSSGSWPRGWPTMPPARSRAECAPTEDGSCSAQPAERSSSPRSAPREPARWQPPTGFAAVRPERLTDFVVATPA